MATSEGTATQTAELTEREAEMVRLVDGGASVPDAADQMGVKPGHGYNLRASAFRKLGRDGELNTGGGGGGTARTVEALSATAILERNLADLDRAVESAQARVTRAREESEGIGSDEWVQRVTDQARERADQAISRAEENQAEVEAATKSARTELRRMLKAAQSGS